MLRSPTPTKNMVMRPRKTQKPRSPAIRTPFSIKRYPRIPCRKSSIVASLSDSTDCRAASTRTPSLSESFELRIVKIRDQTALGSQDSESCDQWSEDDPFVDRACSPTSLHQRTLDAETSNVPVATQHRLSPSLVDRWSSDSQTSFTLSVPSFPTGASHQSRLLTPQYEPFSPNRYLEIKPDFLCPLNLPITFLDVSVLASKSHFGGGSESLWATVQVSADVSSDSCPGPSGLAPLEVIILLDQVPRPLGAESAQINFASVVIASHLVHEHDRIALAVVDPSTDRGFEILLPLGFHSVDIVRSSLERFANRQLRSRVTQLADVGVVLQHVTKMFGTPSRPAFCHLFYVSAAPPDCLRIPPLDHAIGVHTVAPVACLPVDRPGAQSGWHIRYDIHEGDDYSGAALFIRKVSKAVGHLRTGIRPGSVSELSLSVSAAHASLVETCPANYQLMSLRPGETWVTSIPLLLQPASRQRGHVHHSSRKYDDPAPVEDLMTRIDDVLLEYAHEVVQPVMAASLSYKHSLLPPGNTIHINTHLTVTRSF
ncbi:hypothetical protein N7539_002945 [Penicillium diatomitis]|uniref:Uncharacterized protein n=1 Tax=Penicillium diatomitis TaxID=2819901 RepID=A0A9W9XGI9_9EURO|nr:uncharacterized protein N7539_002945 [Penicillium diatomitis]KAJ5491378.1 hypothetical protein N7539_002945 [Penicillium diatomitis]